MPKQFKIVSPDEHAKSRALRQHGDVLFRPVDEIPTGAVPAEKRHLVAEGEMTGHAHVLNAVLGGLVLQHAEKKFVKTEADTNVSHEEHDTLDIPAAAGDHEIGCVQEHDPVNDVVRNVVD